MTLITMRPDVTTCWPNWVQKLKDQCQMPTK